jgi:hypothetical protein
MPAARFWQFEDAQVDFGTVDAAPEDLARMLLVEFALSYGNDWFVIPVQLEVGTLTRTQSLVITNTFGERFSVPSSNDAGSHFATWRMFQLSALSQPSAPDASLFVLPPTLVTPLESQPIEEVLFLRDEMANLAWGVEKVIESAIEKPLKRFEQQRYADPPKPDQSPHALKYLLTTNVPEHWIPLIPVRMESSVRLRRGRVLGSAGAKSLVLDPPATPEAGLALFEEEIPREGARVTRTFQMARSSDGSTHLWIGRRKHVGRGEGSSGLRFDRAEG